MSPILIAGLGNPGSKYEHTRHNIGFDILDSLAHSLGVGFEPFPKFQAFIAKLPSKEIILIKPQTFMNLSGNSIAPVMNFYKISTLLVIHDDLDLQLGCIRFKQGGSSGGHNGLKSIDSSFGNNYYRLRFGISRSEKIPVIDYVLQKFTPQESDKIPSLLEHCVESIKFFIDKKDFLLLQNKFTQNIKNEVI
ncbi:aminoacyl-tRNA hydrolase [Helicobacter cappadocius]|uniref:Peptidyl-tRNA hydrolase n=1 Tax=Helicobacter cappadocius TaxID=3063998 RepID=A0AA90T5P3_9HELI|nr:MULTISPECIES: aminoacyl-tRNA hydrolase [unclassified Helicobacter]MDO7253750.1 aminoacyl-tRNA hydrolase [Helicobacter sp. faydin-H75]MDP2539678.1 aminoacyl-tRNA hydrolase [Helicobacter sp. faydin-H76]